MMTVAGIRAWVGRQAMSGGKFPSGMMVVDARELDALLAMLDATPPADAVTVDAERVCPDCGLSAARIGGIHITAQEVRRSVRAALEGSET